MSNIHYNAATAERFFTYTTEGALRKDVVAYSATGGAHRFSTTIDMYGGTSIQLS